MSNESAAPEIVDITPSEIAGLEMVPDISPSEIPGPAIDADISPSEVACPTIDDGIDYAPSFLEEYELHGEDLENVSVCKDRDDLLGFVVDGDWHKVINFVRNKPIWLQKGITDRGDSILHMAVIDRNLHVVKELIKIDSSSLRYTSSEGNTAFFVNAASGDVDIAEMMVEKDKKLPYIRGICRMTPLHRAASLGRRSMVDYLRKVTDDKMLQKTDLIEILIWSMTHDWFDVALDILEEHSGLALMRNLAGLTALHVLAQRPLKKVENRPSIWKILSGSFKAQGVEPKLLLKLTKKLWCQLVLQDKEFIYETIRTPWPLLSFAVESGKVEFLTLLIQHYPPILTSLKDENDYSIVHYAVIHRQPEIFKLLYSEEYSYFATFLIKYKDLEQNNMLHLAGKLAPHHSLNHVSGAALQMQRELQWFQTVQQCMRSEDIEARNAHKLTPQDLFSTAHEDLRRQGEEWLKKTAESCALAAALIATMVFSAAFQLPGGLNDKGRPVLVESTSFLFFAVSNAVSLFTATASILVFLSILTSRYAERDFLESLPRKLMIGQILLLISITAMVMGFTVTFFMIFRGSLTWPPIVIGILASVPVILFAFEQFPLLAEMYYSSYKYSNTLQPGQQMRFRGSSTQLRSYYGRTFAKMRGRTKVNNHED